MKERRTIITLLAIIFIFGLMLLHDYKKPDCAQAQTCSNFVPNLHPTTYNAERYADSGNTSSGLSSAWMGGTTNRFCALTRVRMRDIDSGNEYPVCEIRSESGSWRLRAERFNSTDADVFCSARCIYW